MKAPMFKRICAHSGSSLGSNTTHLVPRNRLSSMNRARRRMGTYLYSSANALAPRRVRAPQTTLPSTGKVRRQLTPIGFSSPFSSSVSLTFSPWMPLIAASSPAGAFHTPRLLSVRAMMPATAPQGTKGSVRPSRLGSAASR